MVWTQKLANFMMQHADDIARTWNERQPTVLDSAYGYAAVVDAEAADWSHHHNANLTRLLSRGLSEDIDEELKSVGERLGLVRAKQNLNIGDVLERFSAYRSVLRKYLFDYYNSLNTHEQMDDLFTAIEHFLHGVDRVQESFASAYQCYKEEIIRSQRLTIHELTVPVMPVNEDVCVLPLVGVIDTQRAKQIMEMTLARTMELQARFLVIDISGVMIVDTMVAQRLFEIVKALRLMGTTSILTGIRPEVAQTMVQLGIQMSENVETIGNLRQALRRIEVLKQEEAKMEKYAEELFTDFR